MNIAYKNYQIVQTRSLNYDLVETVNRERIEKGTKKGTGEFRDVQKEHGYDMRMETCVDMICKLELAKDDSTVDLKTFLKEYNRIKEELLTIIKN
jgi:hypothetical protein